MSNQKLAEALRTIVNDKGSAQFNSDLEAYDAALETAREALAEHDAQSFADSCEQFAERLRNVSGSNPGLHPSDRNHLYALEHGLKKVADYARMRPDLHQEPRA